MSTIRILLSHALQKDWKIIQSDIPVAFLNGMLESEVYIYPPEGLEIKSSVLRLRRALYGLKESPKVWNNRFDEFVQKNGFKKFYCRGFWYYVCN